jgi:hypothetical protein
MLSSVADELVEGAEADATRPWIIDHGADVRRATVGDDAQQERQCGEQ